MKIGNIENATKSEHGVCIMSKKDDKKVTADQIALIAADLTIHKRNLIIEKSGIPRDDRVARKAKQTEIDEVCIALHAAVNTLTRGKKSYSGRIFAGKLAGKTAKEIADSFHKVARHYVVR